MKKFLLSLLVFIPSFLFSQITYYQAFPSSYTTDAILSQQGKIWSSSFDAGIGYFDNNNWTMYDSVNSNLPTNTIYSIFEKNDSLILGSDCGILICQKNPFSVLHVYDTTNGLSSNTIFNALWENNRLIAFGADTVLNILQGTWQDYKVNITPFYFFKRYDLNSPTVVKYNYTEMEALQNDIIIAGENMALRFSGGNFSLLDSIYCEKKRLEKTPDNKLVIGNSVNDYHMWDGNTKQSFLSLYEKEKTICLINGSESNYLAICDSNLFIYRSKIENSSCFIIIDSVYAKPYEVIPGFPNKSIIYSYIDSGIVWCKAFDHALFSIPLSDFYSTPYIFKYEYLEINKVHALLSPTALVFHDENLSVPNYRVPFPTNKNTIFSLSPWIGGLDPQGKLHLSAERFATNGAHFCSGPLDTTTATLSPATMQAYKKVWNLTKYQIEEFKWRFDNGLLTSGNYQIPADILSWPAHGTGNQAKNLAPFVDVNGDAIYNPYDGDYPDIEGDQMLYWIINDTYNPQLEGMLPLGVEIHCSAYAYKFDNPQTNVENLINYQSFLRFKVINRSDTTYDNCLFSVFTDGDLGYHNDDYIGCDVQYNSYFFYNAFAEDGTGRFDHYGKNPPVQSVTILKGPLVQTNDGIDNNHNMLVDEPGEWFGLSRFVKFNNTGFGSTATIDPEIASEYYLYMNGYWRDSTQICYGGDGHQNGGGNPAIPCKYVFPAASDPYGWGTNGVVQPSWDEVTEMNQPYDRRGVGTMGPFTFHAGSEFTVDILLGWLHDSIAFNTGTKYQASHFTDFYQEMDSLIAWFHNDNYPSNDTNLIHIGVQENAGSTQEILIFPNPNKGEFYIQHGEKAMDYQIYNLNGSLLKEEQNIASYTRVNIAQYSPGIYIIRCFSSNKQKIFKIIKN
jgi:hypothetical protein